MKIPTTKIALAATLAAVVLAPSLTSAGPSGMQKRPGLDEYVVTWPVGDRASTSGAETSLEAPPPTDLEFVAFGAGCRIYDTRFVDGAFDRGEFRDLGVLDGDLLGDYGPCGVPAHAQAVQVSLSTIGGSPAGAGFARLGPGGVHPTATVLQYLAAQGNSVTTTTPLSDASEFRLFSSQAAGYVVDLLGYWERPLWGNVLADGSLLEGSGVTLIEMSTEFLGDYIVTFERPVAPGCAAAATPLGWPDDETRVMIWDGFSSSELVFDVRDAFSADEVEGSFSFVLDC